MRYILASSSPRRKELLEQAGFSFQTVPSSVDEMITETIPSKIVLELASQKAEDVYRKLYASSPAPLPEPDSGITVIGADTIVVYRNEILGKPADKEDAYNMLSLLADRTHEVYTGVSLIVCKNGRTLRRNFYEKTDVTFYPIAKEDLRAYTESGDCLDKAGGYGIQGAFAVHVKGICGDYNNVVGLPIARLYQELIKCR